MIALIVAFGYVIIGVYNNLAPVFIAMPHSAVQACMQAVIAKNCAYCSLLKSLGLAVSNMQP